MTNLVKLTNTPSFEYDWQQVTDSNDRRVASAAVDQYKTAFTELRSKAEQIIKDDNVAKARCVYQLKLSLPHGQFRDVCQEALNINRDTASALASTGKMLIEGTHKEEVLQLLQVMEPRAGKTFMKMDDESKSRYVATFEETGKVPSQKTFVEPSRQDYPRKTSRNTTTSKPSVSTSSIGQKLNNAQVSVQEVLQFLIDLSSSKQPSEATRELIEELHQVACGEVVK